MLRCENFTTLSQKGEKLSISYAFYSSENEKKTASHHPKFCAIEISTDTGIGAQGGMSVSSQNYEMILVSSQENGSTRLGAKTMFFKIENTYLTTIRKLLLTTPVMPAVGV